MCIISFFKIIFDMLICNKCKPKSVKASNEPAEKSFDCKVCGRGFDKKNRMTHSKNSCWEKGACS